MAAVALTALTVAPLTLELSRPPAPAARIGSKPVATATVRPTTDHTKPATGPVASTTSSAGPTGIR